MIIPLWVALIAYALGVLAVAAFGIMQSIVLFQFGKTFSAFVAVCVFWGIGALILFPTLAMLSGVDWNQPLLDTAAFFAPTL